MKEKMQRFSLYLLCFQTGLALASNPKVIGEVGKKVSLPCGYSSGIQNQDIQWNKDGSMFVKYTKVGKTGRRSAGSDRFTIPSRTTNNLETTNVQLEDAGTFSCVKPDKTETTVVLVVFEVSAEPSNILIMSENLKLSVKSSLTMGFVVSWWKDDKKIGDGPNLEVKNITVDQSGDYTCLIRMNDGSETRFLRAISVKGFSWSPSIVYTSGKQPIILPFLFNFKVRDSPLLGEVLAVRGHIKYISNPVKILEKLTSNSGATSWSPKSEPPNFNPKSNPENLSFYIRNPKSGLYQLEIVLEIGKREMTLHKDVCVANLTVSKSHSSITSGYNVTLLCSVDCIEKEGRLCWRHVNKSYDICGPPGKEKLSKEITILPETSGNWTCGVFVGERRLASVNLTLEILDLTTTLFWVTVAAGVIVFFLIVTILTIMIARHRRVRRARYRAWLLENLHQHRTCECDYKGFAPQRLRQNV
ncbi:T-cell surface glycoprotein CD4-like [Dendropsophus ebraccatus]|uniref:T-cell surface glycoprotein CD4-like n=1 Tax=Dendropsophus ebraccatus TaxID=150705 RepID=UPI0038314E75